MSRVTAEANADLAEYGYSATLSGAERARREASARDGYRYRLKAADGSYLHFSCLSTTTEKAHAWFGTRSQLFRLRASNALAKSLKPVRVSA